MKKQTKRGNKKVDLKIKGTIPDFDHKTKKTCTTTNCGGCGYFLGFIGAAVYYISTANSFWMGVLGFLKAIVWPAFLIYELMKFLAM